MILDVDKSRVLDSAVIDSPVMGDTFAAAIQKTDNYYVIVTRERIPSLPYSVEEIELT